MIKNIYLLVGQKDQERRTEGLYFGAQKLLLSPQSLEIAGSGGRTSPPISRTSDKEAKLFLPTPDQ